MRHNYTHEDCVRCSRGRNPAVCRGDQIRPASHGGNQPIPPSRRWSPAHADDYVGKTVQVQGKITSVCQMMGCWMELTNDAGQHVRIKVEDGVIVFPKDAAGKVALAEGKFTRTELDARRASRRASQRGSPGKRPRKFDPAKIKTGMTLYQIEGAGAVIQ